MHDSIICYHACMHMYIAIACFFIIAGYIISTNMSVTPVENCCYIIKTAEGMTFLVKVWRNQDMKGIISVYVFKLSSSQRSKYVRSYGVGGN